MKKLWCILLLLLLPLAASAEEYHYTLSNGRRCQAVTFAAQAPEPLAGALADSQFAGDELLCGVLLTHMRENPVRVESRQALVALRHGEKTLLLWCSHSSETGWKLAVAAEDFLRADQPFTIEAVPHRAGNAFVMYQDEYAPHSVSPAVCYGQERFLIGGGRLLSYFATAADGSRMAISSGGSDGLLALHLNVAGTYQEEILPGYGTLTLTELSADTFPTTYEAARRWCAQRPWPDHMDAMSAGVNLRAKQDSKARLIGWVNRGAPMTILETSPDGRWYHVRVGDTEGWAYSAYVHKPNEYFSFTCADTPLPVARVNKAAQLRSVPGGDDLAQLPQGSVMHVLGKIDGWLHVVVAEGDVGFYPQPNATYGYIREKDATQYECLMEMKYAP